MKKDNRRPLTYEEAYKELIDAVLTDYNGEYPNEALVRIRAVAFNQCVCGVKDAEEDDRK